jgi:capsular polysaccharide biosynthesis protein
VETLEKGKVVGDARLAATADDLVMSDVQALHGEAEPAAHWSYRQRRLRIPRWLSGTSALLAMPSGNNVYHWMIESLPRLKFLSDAGWTMDRIDWVLVNELQRPLHAESLELFGIPAAKVVRCHKRCLLQAERLVVPAVPGAPGVSPAWVVHFLREQVLGKLKGGAGRLVFISRRDASRRHLANEEEVLCVLEPLGFRIVLMEKLAFAEQAAVFAEADCVVAPHGAALSHVVFAREGAALIELFAPEYVNPCYANLAGLAGMRHVSIVCRPDGGPVRGRNETADMLVPIEDLLSACRRFI